MTQDAQEIVGAHWSKMARGASPIRSWTDSPIVMRHVNRMISGDPDVGWLEYVCRKYLIRDGTGVGRGLSIGCGGGALERQVRQMAACERIDAYDIAQGAIDLAKQTAAQAGISGISYAVANLNELKLSENMYDVVFASSSVHHIANLENLFATVETCLKPNGLFILLEYVGASQFQLTDKAVRIINELLDVLPTTCRERSSLPGEYVTRFERSTLEHMNAADPSEAIRSAEILPLLSQTFTILEKKDYGGTINHMLLWDIVQNFGDGSPERAGMLNLLLYLEMLLVKEKVITSDFCLVVAAPSTDRGTRQRLR
jgi:ubiquinone/menaquinone biosynthesis C-methylase UbiE